MNTSITIGGVEPLTRDAALGVGFLWLVKIISEVVEFVTAQHAPSTRRLALYACLFICLIAAATCAVVFAIAAVGDNVPYAAYAFMAALVPVIQNAKNSVLGHKDQVANKALEDAKQEIIGKFSTVVRDKTNSAAIRIGDMIESERPLCDDDRVILTKVFEDLKHIGDAFPQ